MSIYYVIYRNAAAFIFIFLSNRSMNFFYQFFHAIKDNGKKTNCFAGGDYTNNSSTDDLDLAVVVDYTDRILLSVTVFAVLLLCLLALVIACNRKNQKSFEILMINLFIQNIVFFGTLIFVYFYILTEFVHKLLVSVHWCCYFLQLGTIFITAIQKAYIVCYPIKAKIWITKKRTIVAVIVEYIVFSIMVSICLYENFHSECLKTLDRKVSVVFIILALVFIIMTLSVIAANVSIIHKLTTQAKQTIVSADREKLNKRRRKTALVLCLLFVSYVLSYIAPAFMVFQSVGDKKRVFLMGVFIHLLCSDSFVNALLYLLLNTTIIVKVKKLINCK